MRAGDGIVRAGDGIVRAGEGSKKKLNLLLPFHPLTNIEIVNIIKTNRDLMVCIREIIYQIKLKKERMY